MKKKLIAIWRTISARTRVFINILLEIMIQSALQSSMEKERGIAGYTDTQDQLEMISASKGEVDEKKGQILEDMSDMVCLQFDLCFLKERLSDTNWRHVAVASEPSLPSDHLSACICLNPESMHHEAKLPFVVLTDSFIRVTS